MDNSSCPMTRREAVKNAGGWLIFAGVLGAEGCGPQAYSRGGTTTSASCNCTQATGTNTGLKTPDVPLNGVAYNQGQSLFICHDSTGFYCLDSLCTHAGCDIGAQGGFQAANLAAGFFCGCHGSSFGPNGSSLGGPAPNPLPHYHLGVDGTGTIWIDASIQLSDPSCRCS